MIDGTLVERLRDLALVEVDALLAGVPEDERSALLAAHVADLEDALTRARDGMNQAMTNLAREQMAWISWPGAKRAGDDGAEAARQSAESLVERARLAREAAALAEAAARVVPRLVAADRRQIGS